MSRIARAVLAFVFLTAPIVAAADADAQNYPSRAIKIIVPFPPGGNPDIATRIVAEQLSKSLGQPVVVENRPGANGGIGTQAVAKSPPDGYTLLGANLGILGINPAVYDKLLYDPAKDLVPISRFVISQLLADRAVRTPASIPWRRSWPKAKAEPGKLTYSSSGNGSASHLAGVLFNQLAGTDMTHVPYRGTGGASTDVAAGMISINFGGQGASWPLVEAGKVRALASTGDRRLSEHPNTPIVKDTVPGYYIVDWTGLLAPAGTPQPIIDRLSVEVGKVFKDPEVAKKFLTQGLEPAAGTPAEFASFIVDEQKKWVGCRAQIRRARRTVKIRYA